MHGEGFPEIGGMMDRALNLDVTWWMTTFRLSTLDISSAGGTDPDQH